MNKHYVIIGNGIAGLSAAEELRKNDQQGNISILTEEGYLTYHRLKLSHYISKELKLNELLVHDEQWYKDKNIAVRLNTKAVGINPDDKSVKLENGETVYYDKLLLANGSRSFLPPVEGSTKGGVFTLRNLKDLENLQSYLKNTHEVAVVGGGLLGLEAAWALKERGLKVKVLEFFKYLLPRQLDEELANYVKEQLETKGLEIYLSAESKEIVGENSSTGISLKDGREISSDSILFSVGVRPNVDLVKDTSIEVNKGIKVDSHMRTSVEDIYAAGDIAEVDNTVLALWFIALEQGKIAAQNMTGNNASYELPQPSTLLDIGGFKVFSVGDISGEKQTLIYKDKDAFHKVFIQDDKLVGGVLTGDIKKMVKLKKAVNEKKDISDIIVSEMNALELIEKL